MWMFAEMKPCDQKSKMEGKFKIKSKVAKLTWTYKQDCGNQVQDGGNHMVKKKWKKIQNHITDIENHEIMWKSPEVKNRWSEKNKMVDGWRHSVVIPPRYPRWGTTADMEQRIIRILKLLTRTLSDSKSRDNDIMRNNVWMCFSDYAYAHTQVMLSPRDLQMNYILSACRRWHSPCSKLAQSKLRC